jgi:hypothetical protein
VCVGSHSIDWIPGKEIILTADSLSESLYFVLLPPNEYSHSRTGVITLDELANYFIRKIPGIISPPDLKLFSNFKETQKAIIQHMYTIFIGTESIAAS